jgi:hypothetical protein
MGRDFRHVISVSGVLVVYSPNQIFYARERRIITVEANKTIVPSAFKNSGTLDDT